MNDSNITIIVIDDKDKKPGFWTPETIAVLTMIGIVYVLYRVLYFVVLLFVDERGNNYRKMVHWHKNVYQVHDEENCEQNELNLEDPN